MTKTILTIFSFGYCGWGPHTRELLSLVDASERRAGFSPPLWVDIRYHRNVRAAGFNSMAFANLVGPARYLWMQGLGNRAVAGRTGDSVPGIKIHNPADAELLLATAVDVLRTSNRRTIFFCSCPSWAAKGCHRYTVGGLVLQVARKQKMAVAISEWPGNEPKTIVKVVPTILLRQIESSLAKVPDLPMTGALASLPHDLPCGTVIRFKAGEDDELALVVGPANPGAGWKLQMLGSLTDPDDREFRDTLVEERGFGTRFSIKIKRKGK
jgi:hypothetical protein